MATRIVEGKKPYTGGKAISIDENKVISLNLRDENNLIIYDEGDDEIYVDLQLPDGIEPTDAFPVGVTTGRVIVADGWDKAGTIISAKTTSGDEIKILYADEGTLWIDNGTGTFKQIYFKADVDAIAQAIWDYIYANCNTKTFYDGTMSMSLAQEIYDWISQGNFGIVYFNPVSGIRRDIIFPPTTTTTGTISSWSYTDVRQAIGGMFYEDLITLEFGVSDGVATTGINSHGVVINNEGRLILSQPTAPNAIEGTTWYDETTHTMKVWDGTAWQSVGGGDVLVSDQANNIFTPGMKIWGGTESDFNNLTPDSNTAYLLLAGGPTPPSPRQPGANTVAYLPLSSDLADTISGNNLTGNATFGTIGGSTVNCAITTSNGLSGTLANLPQGTAERTVSMWFYFSGSNTNEGGTVFYGTGGGNNQVFGAYSELNGGDWKISLSQRGANSGYLYTWTTGSWYLITMTYDSNNDWKLYINGTYIGQWNKALGTIGNDILLGTLVWNVGDYLSGGFSELIIEDKCWDAQEISDYYNQTKGNYGIS